MQGGALLEVGGQALVVGLCEGSGGGMGVVREERWEEEELGCEEEKENNCEDGERERGA